MKSAQRENGLDVVKGILIMFVIISHFAWSQDERLGYLFPFWIDMAVPFFMLISGYVYAASFEKNNIACIEAAYETRFVLKKLIRYTVPYIIAYVAEMFIYYYIRQTSFSAQSYFSIFLRGGAGAGSYYWPIMVQFVFVFPVIYFVIKKNPKKGLLFVLCANAAYELIQRAYDFNESSYRLLLFRYLFLIGFGCFLFLYQRKINIMWYVLLVVVGAGSIIAWRYYSMPPLIVNYWIGTCYVCSMFIIPAFALVIKYLKNMRLPGMEVVGKASYNIFLVQMLFYDIPQEYIAAKINSRVLQLLFGLVVCVVVGILFWIVEKRITQKVLKIMEHVWKK